MLRNIIITLVLCVGSIAISNTQSYPVEGWHLMDDSSFPNGISIDRTYNELLKGKTPEPVVVAVIDSGVDAEHEDLIDIMWVNPGEIPNNGIDDDKNGYIDDIHGWNFIGGPDGTNVEYDTYEATRLVAKYRYKYEYAVPGKLEKQQLEEYEIYQEAKKVIEKERSKAQRNLDEINDIESSYFSALHAVKEALDGKMPTEENLDSLNTYGKQELFVGVQIVKNINAQLGETISMDELISLIGEAFDYDKEPYFKKVEYGYNEDFDPRSIVGDNYTDNEEMIYGNNDVEGPDADHGTHVAGIIGAVRDNEIGIQGVSNNVRIMSVRAVPDGDERDKDVANAIRYAVDNGASIINMSFGKGFSWNKEIVDDAIRYAQKKDVLLVHAAGNANKNIDQEDNFPNDVYEKPKGFLFCKKKEAKNWIEVGALSWESGEDMIASFSNYGKERVDVFAPGMAILSTVPDNGYQIMQGTSMASPVVAGIAAVLRSYFPKLKAEQVKDIIMNSTDPITGEVKVPGSEELLPLSELSKSGGIVNVYTAVELASKTEGKKKIKKKKEKHAKA